MRQSEDARKRREQFLSDALGKALSSVLWVDQVVSQDVAAGGSKHGADKRVARVRGVEGDVDPRLMALGFSVLFDDQEDHGGQTQLDGVSTRWRDDMIHARRVSDIRLVSEEDAGKVLDLALEDDAEDDN